MLNKKYKLTGKDINFLFKQQKIIPGKYFSFFFYPQYPNKNYNQFALQVPLKLSKKATHRNRIKRLIFNWIKDNQLQKQRIGQNYYKIFIIFNKKSIPLFKETIETKQKKLIKEKIINNFDFSLNSLIKKLGK